MAKYQLVEYDVWGNPTDGFDVNNTYKTDVEYEISDSDTDSDIIRKLCTEEKIFPSVYSIHGETRTFLNPESESKVRIGFEDEFFIEIENDETGEPIARLDLVED